jgi:hypothetical protein
MRRSTGFAKRLARLERAFGYSRRTREYDQMLSRLRLLSPEERRERMHVLAARIVKHRGIELGPGERVEDAALRALKQIGACKKLINFRE